MTRNAMGLLFRLKGMKRVSVMHVVDHIYYRGLVPLQSRVVCAGVETRSADWLQAELARLRSNQVDAWR